LVLGLILAPCPAPPPTPLPSGSKTPKYKEAYLLIPTISFENARDMGAMKA